MTQANTASLKVISSARKLILEVVDGPVVKFPEGVEPNPYSANKDEPRMVVYNSEDQTWQGAGVGDMIILNQVPEEVAEHILNMYDGTNEGTLKALDYAASQGYTDQYTTNMKFRSSNLSPAGRMVNENTGIVKRDERDVCEAYYDKTGLLRIVTDGVRDIKEDIFLSTYRNLDGTKINLEDVPKR